MDPAQPNTPAETTPATPPAAPPNAGAPPAAPATPPNPRLAKLAALGFENVKDEGEALDRLYDAHVQMKDQFGQQLQQTLEQVRAQVQPPAAPEAGQRPKFFDPPKVDLAVVAQYREADGNWKENTPSEVKNAALAYQGYVEAFGRKLLTDPEATLAPLIERIAARVAEERYGQATAQQQEAQFFERAYAENEWLFEKSPHTGRVDRQRLSAEGQRFNDLMLEAHERLGIASQKQQFEYAMKIRALEQQAAGAKQLTPQAAQQARTEQQSRLLGRAAPDVSRTGSLPDQPVPKNRNLLPGHKFLQQLERDGALAR